MIWDLCAQADQRAHPRRAHKRRSRMGTNLADTRIIVIAAAQLSTEQARMREERPPAGRPIEAGEPHAALASAANGQPEDR